MSAPLLEFDQVCKTYGHVRACDKVSFSLEKGLIHAIIGENGAGKSTLMKILFGLEKADQGVIRLRGQEFRCQSPIDAKKRGIGMVQQHFHLAAELTALEHVVLEEPRPFWQALFDRIDRKSWKARLEELSVRFSMPMNWDAKVSELSVGFQQRLEILKLLAFETDIMILDEPTAVLSPVETEQFLERLRLLRESGKTVILITHKLREVLAVSDTVTVLRQGRCIGSYATKDQSAQSLASLMVGDGFLPSEIERRDTSSEILLQVKDLSCSSNRGSHLQDVNFEIKAGEIFGIAGVHGNGQSELIKALIAPRESHLHFSGAAFFSGKDLLQLSSNEIRSLNIGFVPEDRLEQGVIPALNAEENYQLGRFDFFDGQKVLESKRNQELTSAVQDFDVRPPNPLLTFSSFSGGNQQKMVIARELTRKARLLVIAEPTRGVDIGAIERIHASIAKARNEGAAILLISSELEELMRLSDRLAVFSKGRLKQTLNRGEFSIDLIGRLMGGET